MSANDTADCLDCLKQTTPEPCDSCAQRIHESWHLQGMWWIRPEMCSESCPGWKKEKERLMKEGE